MQKLHKKVNKSEWVIVGRFGRPQGLKGFIRVNSFTEPASNILDYVPWHVNIRDTWTPVKIIDVETHVKFILVQIEGYSQREQIALLTNCDIAIPQHQLPTLSADDYYWHDLVGMQVLNQNEEVLGVVTEMLATGSNDVLIITGDKRHLVPYLPGEVVTRIDAKQRIIYVNWDADF